MRRLTRRGVVLALVLLTVAPGAASARFDVGFQDPGLEQAADQPEAQIAAQALLRADATMVRVAVHWSTIAPAHPAQGFRPSDPSDPGYRWAALDLAVRRAAELHQQVMLNILSAPSWAEGANRPSNPSIRAGAWDPRASDFAAFARAIAMRYGGSFPDPGQPGTALPRVRYWEVWNEENLPIYLAAPDLVGGYRTLLNAGYDVIKAVHPDNVVVMGGLAPVSYLAPLSASPLKFAADLLCLRRSGRTYHPLHGCPHVRFDVFAHHPYSLAATPTKRAYNYDDVLIGDMDKIATLVAAADRLHTVAGANRHPIWVTEFGWFTNPPNKLVGDSNSIAARYVAFSLYEMWKNGVKRVIWQTIEDILGAGIQGGGLYTSSGKPKLMLSAFSFPLVASIARGHGLVWGRAPMSTPASVIIERRAGRRWVRLGIARTGSDGVFTLRFGARHNGMYRALIAGGQQSLPYDSTPIPPRRTHLFSSG